MSSLRKQGPILRAVAFRVAVETVAKTPRPVAMGPCFRRDDKWGKPKPYGTAAVSDACSAASTTQALRRCRPRIAPVTLSTLPTGQEASCTKAIS